MDMTNPRGYAGLCAFLQHRKADVVATLTRNGLDESDARAIVDDAYREQERRDLANRADELLRENRP